MMSGRSWNKALSKETIRKIIKIKDSDHPLSLYMDSSDEYSSSVDDPVYGSSESCDQFDYISYEQRNITPDDDEEMVDANEKKAEDGNPEPMNVEAGDTRYQMTIDGEGVVHVLERYPETMADDLEMSLLTCDSETSTICPEAETDPMIAKIKEETEAADGMTEVELESNVKKEVEHELGFVYVDDYAQPDLMGEANPTAPEVELSAFVEIESFQYLTQGLMTANRDKGPAAMTVKSTKHVEEPQMSKEMGTSAMTVESTEHFEEPQLSEQEMKMAVVPPKTTECVAQLLRSQTTSPRNKFEYGANVEQYQHKLFHKCKLADIIKEAETKPSTSNHGEIKCYHNPWRGRKVIKKPLEVIEEDEPDPNVIFRFVFSPNLFSDSESDDEQPTYGEQHEKPVVFSDSGDSVASSDSVTTNQREPKVVGRFFYNYIPESDESNDEEGEWFKLGTDQD